MALRIEAYSSRHLDTIRALNARFRAAGVNEGFMLPEETGVEDTADAFETLPAEPLRKRQFLLLDGDVVRGGFILQDQQFHLKGRTEWVANIQMPVTEGLVDRRYAHFAIGMIQAILKRSRLAFAVGMGGMDRPFPRFLAASKWHVMPAPFLFHVLRPSRFLLEMPLLRSSPARAMLTRIAAMTGAGAVGVTAAQKLSALRHGGGATNRPAVVAERVAEWGVWADDLWENYRTTTSLAAVRDSANLRLFHPPDGNLEIERCRHGDRIVGWFAEKVTTMQGSAHFGNLRVATILDSVSLPGYERAVTKCALATARAHRAELVVANQLHHTWTGAMRQCGFLDGPSNYICALSPGLRSALEPIEQEISRVHISRADGDGRVHL